MEPSHSHACVTVYTVLNQALIITGIQTCSLIGRQCIDCCHLINLFREAAHLQASDIKESLCLLNILVISLLIIITSVTDDFVTKETFFKVKRSDLVIRQSHNPTAISILPIGSDYQDSTVHVHVYVLMSHYVMVKNPI